MPNLISKWFNFFSAGARTTGAVIHLAEPRWYWYAGSGGFALAGTADASRRFAYVGSVELQKIQTAARINVLHAPGTEAVALSAFSASRALLRTAQQRHEQDQQALLLLIGGD